jgi:hypothetical protein
MRRMGSIVQGADVRVRGRPSEMFTGSATALGGGFRFLRTQPNPLARAPALPLPVKTLSLSPFGAAPSEREPLKAFLFEEGGGEADGRSGF